jgi:ADP-heptose:LPS heptosyltransferase
MRTLRLKKWDAALSPAACLAASWLPKPARPLSEKVLILRPGGLGDLVCADIALQELSLDARNFDWVIESRSQPWALFRDLPHRCYDVNPRTCLAKISGRYPLVINTEQLYGLAQAYALRAHAARARLFCFETNRGSSWSDHAVPYDWKDRHETIEFARLFAAALDRPEPGAARSSRPRLFAASEPPLVLMAGRQSPSRRLDLESWTTLIAQWRGQRSFLIAASPEDTAFAREVASHFEGVAQLFTGSFSDLCGQIARCEELLTMDGGGVHIASFFGVPTLALFSSGRDRKWHPLGEGSRILRRHDLACQPCTKFGQVPPCPFGFACLKMEDIAPTNPWP